MLMAALAGAFAVACLAVGVVHLARLVVMPTGRLGEASYAAMGIGMAAMFSPFGDPVPAPVWAVVFVSSGLWFGVVALRSDAGPVRTDAVHQVLGSGGMLLMLLVGHDAGPAAGPVVVSVVAIVLAGYFAWHVLRCADRLRADRLRAAAAAVTVRAPALRAARTQHSAHLVMAAAMSVMLVGMV